VLLFFFFSNAGLPLPQPGFQNWGVIVGFVTKEEK
jgi:hypothetical protein